MPKFITIRTCKGKRYVSVVENFYEEVNGKKIKKQRTIKSLGNLDKLLEDDPNILEKLKQQYTTCYVRALHEETVKKYINEVKDSPVSDFARVIGDVSKQKKQISPRLNYGIWALMPLWNDVLGLKYKINYLRDKEGLKFDVNKAVSFLSYLKVVDPSSQLKAFEHQSEFLYEPLKDIGLHNLYRSLNFMSRNRDEIMAYINKRLIEQKKRETSLVFYDCTNCYFETPYDDKQKEFRSVLHDVYLDLMKDGTNIEDIDDKFFEGEFAEIIDAEVHARATEETEFRMRGLSKEHQYDLPLVSVALVIDTQGIPVDFQVFAGNTSEYKTMPKVIKEMNNKYNITSSIVVANRGLNSLANLNMLIDEGLGFAVAQKISNLKGDYEKQMLELNSYKPLPGFTPEEDLFEGALYKRMPFCKVGKVEKVNEEGESLTVSQKLDCEIVFTYSRSRRARDLNQLRADVAQAKKAVSIKKDMAPTCSSGWRSLVSCKKDREKLKKENKNTEAKYKSIYTAESLKKELIEKRRRQAGFSAIVYKKAQNATTDLTDKELLGTYHHLVKIEQCFRIMKSNFSLRPMFIRKKKRIEGHVTICVISLILLRLLELKLESQNTPLSTNTIMQALSNATVTAVSSDGKDGFYIKQEIMGKVYSRENLIKKNKDETVNVADNWIENYVDKSDAIGVILQAVGLSELNSFNSPTDIARALKLHGGYVQLTGTDNSEIQQKLSSRA